MATIGVSKPYYAVYSNTGTTVKYAEGGVAGKATELNIEIEAAEDNALYADNTIAENDTSFSGGTLTVYDVYFEYAGAPGYERAVRT